MSSASNAVVAAAALLIGSATYWYVAPQPSAEAGPHVLTLPPMMEAPPTVAHHPDELWICADPDNLPFSNAGGEGFENRIAALVARAMDRTLRYSWQPSGERFALPALESGECDVIVGVPARPAPGVTRPYYRSSYVFVTRPGMPPIASFADPRLDALTVGVQLSGDEAEAPPARAMATHRRAAQIRGYVTNSLVTAGAPARRIVDAVANGEIATAAVWGPLAGFYAADRAAPLTLTPIRADGDLEFAFDIAMAARADDVPLIAALNRTLAAQQRKLLEILRDYDVPLLPMAAPGTAPIRTSP
jgi:mxaJ protein